MYKHCLPVIVLFLSWLWLITEVGSYRSGQCAKVHEGEIRDLENNCIEFMVLLAEILPKKSKGPVTELCPPY